MAINVDNSKKISKLQLTQGKFQSGMTEQNHLVQAYLTEPAVNKAIAMVFGYRYKQPMTLLASSMNKEVIDNRQFDWWLMGDSEKSIKITVPPTEVEPGIYNSTFAVGLEEKYFGAKDIIATDDRTIIRLVSEPMQEGSNWMHVFEVMSGDPADFVDPDQLSAGRYLSREYTSLAEFDEGGITTAATPFKLRNQLSTIAKSDAITRSAATDVMVISLPDPDGSGKTTNLWTRYKEWIFMQQWYREQERLMQYSRFNSTAQGYTNQVSDNGRPIFMGAGIEEQVEFGEQQEYTQLTESIILEFLTRLSYNRKDMTERVFRGLSGEYGLMDFHRAMKEAFNDWNISDASFTISGSNMNLTFGSQFKTYKGLNGMEYTPMHFPLYDDTVIHRTTHPATLAPRESYKHTILDFGSTVSGSNNVTKMVKRDSEDLYWYVAGGFSPTGPAKSLNIMRSHSKDGYSVHALTECGIRIMNPTSCGELYYTEG